MGQARERLVSLARPALRGPLKPGSPRRVQTASPRLPAAVKRAIWFRPA